MTLREHTIQLLEKHGLWAKKKFGQNFLVNEKTLATIVEAGNIAPTDTILEIGPGTGILTTELAKHAKQVITIEKDTSILPVLRDNLSENPENAKKVTIVESDALTTPLPTEPYKIIANIPYNITSLLLVRFLLSGQRRPDLMVLLVQKEVAEKICAQPPDMNTLSILVQTFGKPHIIKSISRHDFLPPPKVESAILKVEMFEKPAVSCDITTFFQIVRAGFGQKRKTILNSLSNTLNIETKTLKKALEQGTIDPIRRAETLNITEWERLTNIIQILPEWKQRITTTITASTRKRRKNEVKNSATYSAQK